MRWASSAPTTKPDQFLLVFQLPPSAPGKAASSAWVQQAAGFVSMRT
jgi:hypothetical protein